MSLYKGLYPQIRYRDGKRRFWNPVYKKTLLPLPEEIVRHRFLEYISLKWQWPLSRISMETGVKVQQGLGRTDMICYDKKFNPWLLIECKAPNIKLTEEVAHQAIQYNQTVNARYVCLTNGMQTLFFDSRDAKKNPEIHEIFSGKESELITDTVYWKKRGFMGEKNQNWDNWLTEACNHFFIRLADDVVYLRPPVIYEHGLNHFYQLAEGEAGDMLAWTIITTPSKSTSLVILKSNKAELKSAGVFSFDVLSSSTKLICDVIQPDGVSKKHIKEKPDLTPDNFSAESLLNTIQNFSKYL